MRSRWQRFRESFFLYSFLRDPMAYVSFAILMILLIGAFGAPLIAPHDPYNPTTIDIMNSELPPAWAVDGTTNFLLGTDDMGRDMFSTMLYGMRISIIIGIGAVLLQATLGIAIGLLSGYIKKLDTILMRIADVQLSFSTYMIAIFIGAIFQTMFGVANYEKIAAPLLILIIGLAEWPQYARTVRASVLAESKKEYVEAARVIGLSKVRIMWRHILPNTLSPVLVISTVQVANAIMSEAALSFLGLGMPMTKPSLGSLITAGFDYIFSGSWWITIFPGILLVLLVLVINLLGDWVRDYLNPKLYKG
ncbi:ABC transporter permease [Pseudodesulfovibrio piezophilus]|uniref:Binding-protein-dependent transport systems inner membrane component n=1 Tax=Pseudodesulfovibrio piezophilus (strain DSM 21447 / JCM 15486 / C1TLV30) TaxID=1322246 RepID=M1WMY7_PSEP2|nr:ABC transporter permease [Pseudodesulfovibrio piezophilus]CCH47274.1 Binding-protein-dependent transport systems inner membrane component [Pseudodesulfovibrio piezophilus C1TLV30]